MNRFLFLIVWVFLLSGLIIGCKKDDPKDPELPPKVSFADSVQNDLKKDAQLARTTEIYNQLKLTETDFNEGLTLFAPYNSLYNIVLQGEEIKDFNLRDYLTKGLYSASDFTENKSFPSFSGKTIRVTKSGSVTLINNMPLQGILKAGSKYRIYILGWPLVEDRNPLLGIWHETSYSASVLYQGQVIKPEETYQEDEGSLEFKSDGSFINEDDEINPYKIVSNSELLLWDDDDPAESVSYTVTDHTLTITYMSSIDTYYAEDGQEYKNVINKEVYQYRR